MKSLQIIPHILVNLFTFIPSVKEAKTQASLDRLKEVMTHVVHSTKGTLDQRRAEFHYRLPHHVWRRWRGKDWKDVYSFMPT
jgi:hypothetical protein